MSFILSAIRGDSFRSIIPIIRVQGMIDSLAASRFEKSFSNFNPKKAKAVAIVVNSPGGYVAPCEAMADTVRIFTQNHKVPVYTFAEDLACSGGYFVLAMGDKAYTDKTSWVGSIGTISQYVEAADLLRKHHINVKTWKSNENLLAPLMDAFAETNKEAAKQDLLKFGEYAHKEFIGHVESFRDSKLTTSKEERYRKLYQGDIWTGAEAVELGLADEIGTYYEVLTREFPKAKLVEVTRKSPFDKFKENALQARSYFTSWDENMVLDRIKGAMKINEKSN